MRNEAKYICCLGGFIGFLSFFTITLLLGDDVLDAVLRGSVGCLFCALCARGLLHLVLQTFYMGKNGEMKETALPILSPNPEEPPSPRETTEQAAVTESTELVPEASPAAAETSPA